MTWKLYRAAEKHYRDVRAVLHHEQWGEDSVEKILLDTNRGLVLVSSSPNVVRHRITNKRSRSYRFSVPMSRAKARLALLTAHDSRLEAAKAAGDSATVELISGRESELAEQFLDTHPAYADEATGDPPVW